MSTRISIAELLRNRQHVTSTFTYGRKWEETGKEERVGWGKGKKEKGEEISKETGME